GEVFNQTVSFVPPPTAEYQKIEFKLYKNREIYISRVLQVLPAIDKKTLPSIVPPQLQNSDMEKSGGWKFAGKEYSGSYNSSEWSSGMRSYQVKAATWIRKGASGSIIQDFSSNDMGFASLSFDVKSDSESRLQVIVNNDVIWENDTGMNWTRIKAPVLLKRSNNLEMRVAADNATAPESNVWWDNIRFEEYSPSVSEIPVKKEVRASRNYSYTAGKNGSNISYLFDSGEKIELNISNGNLSPGDMVYTTKARGGHIVFLGELHEIMLPDNLHHLLPMTAEHHGISMRINETYALKNGYAVTLKKVENITLAVSVTRNNITVSEIISKGNASIEYWKYVSDSSYKKDKIIQLNPILINDTGVIFDIMQYGRKKIVDREDNYEELKIINITADSIIMNNSKPITIEPGKTLSLVKGKIKIKV
ncbi:MAG TPA: hypothetical protein VIO11_06155, partial [Candidatus Methanoperedens sp.]